MLGVPWGMLALAYAPWLLAIAGAFYLGLRGVRALERRTQARAEMTSHEERLLRLEDSLAAMTERVEQLSEGQQFTTRLLEGRE